MAADAYVQLQPDSSGKKVDTTELVVGSNTVERQRIIVADPVQAEQFTQVYLVNPANVGEGGLVVRNMPYGPPVQAPYRAGTGRVLFVEDFSDGMSEGMFNDGCGSACIDHNIRLNGRPSVRLDPQNNSSTATATGGNQQLTLGGSPQTITTSSSSTLVGTTSQAGAPVIKAGALNYILLNGQSGGTSPSGDGNSYVLTYTSSVTSGGSGAWTVTFSGVNVLALPGTPAASVTTANIGTSVMAACNPNPNATGSPLTSGVVYKRRLDDSFSGKFGNSFWFRPTSKSAASSFTSVLTGSLYNRDGQNFWASRCMVQVAVGMNPGTWNNDNQLLWYVTGTSTGGFLWVPFAFSTKTGYSQHSWDPVSGSWDRAGGWNYMKIVADFVNLQYVSIQVNDTTYASMAGVPLYQGIGDTGAKMMHFSIELAQAQSATRRFWNVANVVGTQEF